MKSYIFAALCFLSLFDAGAESTASQEYTFNVMAPLVLETDADWNNFTHNLREARQIGVKGVSVDIWWGMVEAKGDNIFDWTYYRKVANIIQEQGLDWIPIMSFHQCGGNVGDSCDIPIPKWVWTHFHLVDKKSLMFKSEEGNYSQETLSFLVDAATQDQIYQQYAEFMIAFQTEFAEYKTLIQEINISMGPAGELRYPSYNGHDKNSAYPSRGAIQGLSPQAVELWRAKHVRNCTITCAGNLLIENALDNHALNIAFAKNKHLDSAEQPLNNYLNWYHQSLIKHGTKMLTIADKAFSGDFKDISLGYKIPGIHWQIPESAQTIPNARSAEIAAGLIPASSQYDHSNAMGYSNILSIASDFSKTYGREVIVHFTALEMNDNAHAPAHSMAKSLVRWVAKGAQDLNLIIKGENALAAGVYSVRGWNNIKDALSLHYSGITVLRITDVADAQQNRIGYEELKKLIPTNPN
ncbi:family 14 glycosylhydrolase [Glaciecola sp. MH2013]|uniref:family 14 glycosylhydrolase n=1 Tax=Glaciecola sp. MH2013 TaxID=2785524 RepID=UPI00189D59AF|nr:family 14 glycosylhydrolase [Glaciecola sp. MH2013]MBF7073327.1 family 14 glycosylhydrolase [Glaciecola sp. MH2013]